MTSIPTADDFKRIEDELADVKAILKSVLVKVGAPTVLKVADIAGLEGVSRTQIVGKEAYLLPNFGISEYPDGTKRWRIETYLEWRRMPIERRREMFKAHLEHERKKAVTRI